MPSQARRERISSLVKRLWALRYSSEMSRVNSALCTLSMVSNPHRSHFSPSVSTVKDSPWRRPSKRTLPWRNAPSPHSKHVIASCPSPLLVGRPMNHPYCLCSVKRIDHQPRVSASANHGKFEVHHPPELRGPPSKRQQALVPVRAVRGDIVRGIRPPPVCGRNLLEHDLDRHITLLGSYQPEFVQLAFELRVAKEEPPVVLKSASG